METIYGKVEQGVIDIKEDTSGVRIGAELKIGKQVDKKNFVLGKEKQQEGNSECGC